MITEPELDDWWQTLPYQRKHSLKEFVDGVEKGLNKLSKRR